MRGRAPRVSDRRSWRQATTKGLNQIITPDIQQEGLLSISAQVEHPFIGNSEQLQFEAGLTSNFEVALFQGFSPWQTVGAAEYGLVQKPHFLLSTGFLQSATDYRLQPFLEGRLARGKG